VGDVLTAQRFQDGWPWSGHHLVRPHQVRVGEPLKQPTPAAEPADGLRVATGSTVFAITQQPRSSLQAS
jgi:hypothetical protein